MATNAPPPVGGSQGCLLKVLPLRMPKEGPLMRVDDCTGGDEGSDPKLVKIPPVVVTAISMDLCLGLP